MVYSKTIIETPMCGQVFKHKGLARFWEGLEREFRGHAKPIRFATPEEDRR